MRMMTEFLVFRTKREKLLIVLYIYYNVENLFDTVLKSMSSCNLFQKKKRHSKKMEIFIISSSSKENQLFTLGLPIFTYVQLSQAVKISCLDDRMIFQECKKFYWTHISQDWCVWINR